MHPGLSVSYFQRRSARCPSDIADNKQHTTTLHYNLQTSVSQTIRKPLLVKSQTALKKQKK